MISATDELQLVYHCLKLGAADFLTKPIHVKQVENIWQTIWRKNKEEENKAKEQETQEKIQQEMEHKVTEAVTTPIKVSKEAKHTTSFRRLHQIWPTPKWQVTFEDFFHSHGTDRL